jgi:thiol-disulfide isomerase/thioredoxin
MATAITSKQQFDQLLKSTRIVVADCKFDDPRGGFLPAASNRSNDDTIPLADSCFQVYADWCGPCQQIAPHYETIAESLSRPNVIAFVKINNDQHQDLAKQYSVTVLPTFVLFRDQKVVTSVQGANPRELRSVIQSLVEEFDSLGEGSSAGAGDWRGAEAPKGYGDINDQIEIRNTELLNADEDAGPVKVLFQTDKPSALNNGKATSKDWVQSGADDQLLLFVPFQGSIKLHTLQVSCTFS